jgi:hypothetical protein
MRGRTYSCGDRAVPFGVPSATKTTIIVVWSRAHGRQEGGIRIFFPAVRF